MGSLAFSVSFLLDFRQRKTIRLAQGLFSRLHLHWMGVRRCCIVWLVSCGAFFEVGFSGLGWVVRIWSWVCVRVSAHIWRSSFHVAHHFWSGKSPLLLLLYLTQRIQEVIENNVSPCFVTLFELNDRDINHTPLKNILI